MLSYEESRYSSPSVSLGSNGCGTSTELFIVKYGIRYKLPCTPVNVLQHSSCMVLPWYTFFYTRSYRNGVLLSNQGSLDQALM
jgi:hypothetical protein